MNKYFLHNFLYLMLLFLFFNSVAQVTIVTESDACGAKKEGKISIKIIGAIEGNYCQL